MPHEKLVAWNLNVLQRKDRFRENKKSWNFFFFFFFFFFFVFSSIMRIMATASFVTVYEFHGGKWKKLDVEGCMFLVRRSLFPTFQLIVLNKMCPDDHVTELGDFEVNDTYLMMSTPTGIQGFWFYDSQERQLVTLQIQKALNELAGISGMGPTIPFASTIHVEDFENATRPVAAMERNNDDQPGEYDREKFKRVLIKLIQTDAQFVDRIYEEFEKMEL